VTEFAEGGDLLMKIESHKKMRSKFLESELWDYLIQMCRGLQCLHSNRILHRDIKSANIFLSKGVIKIGDLNVSKVNKHGLAVTQTGTPYYACPEVWKDKPYNSSSDVWSVGCVIYEMAALRPPFMANDMKGLYDKVTKGIYPPIPPGYSNDLTAVINLMLQVNPVNRPMCSKLLEMDLIRRHDIGYVPDTVSSNDLLSTIKFVPSMREMTNRLPAANYEKNKRTRGRSINHSLEERSESLGRPRVGVSAERKIDFRLPPRLSNLPGQQMPSGAVQNAGLPPRYAQRGEISDGNRYKNDLSLDRKLNRGINHSYLEESKQSRPLLQAGANVLSGEASTPKPVMNKANMDRILSEPSLDRGRHGK
jgi:serine/threonine protein kinase